MIVIEIELRTYRIEIWLCGHETNTPSQQLWRASSGYLFFPALNFEITPLTSVSRWLVGAS